LNSTPGKSETFFASNYGSLAELASPSFDLPWREAVSEESTLWSEFFS